jgi:SH3-like domain-containing protein
MSMYRRLCVLFLLFAAAALFASPAPLLGQGAGPVTKLPVPRFVSLRNEKVHVRGGPTRDHEIKWIFTRAGLPIEITAEFDNWRRIRDSEGAEGWVHHTQLSGRRTALIAPSAKEKVFPLYARSGGDGSVVAQLQSGVLADVKGCDGKWCRIAGRGFDGFIEQVSLWGVYPNETLE